jgi:hypothetical protein
MFKKRFAECLLQLDTFRRSENNMVKTHIKIIAEVKHAAG